MAAGKMNIDWRIDRRFSLAIGGDFFGMPFGVGGGETAAEIPRAGDETGANRRRLRRKAERRDHRHGFADMLIGDAGDQHILPNGETQAAVAELARDLGETARLLGVKRPTGSATPIQLKPACFCGWTPIWAARS